MADLPGSNFAVPSPRTPYSASAAAAGDRDPNSAPSGQGEIDFGQGEKARGKAWGNRTRSAEVTAALPAVGKPAKEGDLELRQMRPGTEGGRQAGDQGRLEPAGAAPDQERHNRDSRRVGGIGMQKHRSMTVDTSVEGEETSPDGKRVLLGHNDHGFEAAAADQRGPACIERFRRFGIAQAPLRAYRTSLAEGCRPIYLSLGKASLGPVFRSWPNKDRDGPNCQDRVFENRLDRLRRVFYLALKMDIGGNLAGHYNDPIEPLPYHLGLLGWSR